MRDKLCAICSMTIIKNPLSRIEAKIVGSQKQHVTEKTNTMIVTL